MDTIKVLEQKRDRVCACAFVSSLLSAVAMAVIGRHIEAALYLIGAAIFLHCGVVANKEGK